MREAGANEHHLLGLSCTKAAGALGRGFRGLGFRGLGVRGSGVRGLGVSFFFLTSLFRLARIRGLAFRVKVQKHASLIRLPSRTSVEPRQEVVPLHSCAATVCMPGLSLAPKAKLYNST